MKVEMHTTYLRFKSNTFTIWYVLQYTSTDTEWYAILMNDGIPTYFIIPMQYTFYIYVHM